MMPPSRQALFASFLPSAFLSWGDSLQRVVAAVCVLLVGELGYAAYPIWPSLFLSLLAVLPLFVIFSGRYSTFRLIASGLSAGAVGVFRYDMGILAISIVSLALLFYGFAKGTGLAGWRRPSGGVTLAVLGRSRPDHFSDS